jgi:hypothetical protein
MLCVVQKQFGGPEGSMFQVNQLVDASTFRNRDTLLSGRFLRVASPDEVESAEEVDVEEEVPAEPPPTKKKPMAAKARKSRK